MDFGPSVGPFDEEDVIVEVFVEAQPFRGVDSVEVGVDDGRCCFVFVDEGEGWRAYWFGVAGGGNDSAGDGGFSGSEVADEEDDVANL